MSWSVKKWTRNVNQFFNIQESDGTAKNVSGYTITLKVQQGSTLLISATCTLASASLGYVYYTVLSGDFPNATKYNYELELVKGNERLPTETYPLHVGRTI